MSSWFFSRESRKEAELGHLELPNWTKLAPEQTKATPALENEPTWYTTDGR